MKTIQSKPNLYRGFTCDDSGIIDPEGLIQTAYLDGYNFGDRLLEGVPFACTVLPDGSLQVNTHESAARYMAGLNEDRWLTEALDCAIGTDVFSAAPTGGEECFLVFRDPPATPPTKSVPQQIQMTSGADLLKRLGGPKP